MPTSRMIEGSTVTMAVWSAAATNTTSAMTTRSHADRSRARRGADAPRAGSETSAGRDDRDVFIEVREHEAADQVVRLVGRDAALELHLADELVVDADPGGG